MITYDEFKKVEIPDGKILAAEKVAETDKLLLNLWPESVVIEI